MGAKGRIHNFGGPLQPLTRDFFFGFKGKPAPRDVFLGRPHGRIAFANTNLASASDHRNSIHEADQAVKQLLGD